MKFDWEKRRRGESGRRSVRRVRLQYYSLVASSRDGYEMREKKEREGRERAEGDVKISIDSIQTHQLSLSRRLHLDRCSRMNVQNENELRERRGDSYFYVQTCKVPLSLFSTASMPSL